MLVPLDAVHSLVKNKITIKDNRSTLFILFFSLSLSRARALPLAKKTMAWYAQW
jgi:hypothetical protein